jgi:hypothetical protein
MQLKNLNIVLVAPVDVLDDVAELDGGSRNGVGDFFDEVERKVDVVTRKFVGRRVHLEAAVVLEHKNEIN